MSTKLRTIIGRVFVALSLLCVVVWFLIIGLTNYRDVGLLILPVVGVCCSMLAMMILPRAPQQ